MWFTSKIQKKKMSASTLTRKQLICVIKEKLKLDPPAVWTQPVNVYIFCMCVFVCADTLSTAALVVWVEVPGFSLHIWANSAQTDRDWRKV